MKKAEEIFEKYNILFLLPVVAIYLYSRWQYLGEICYYMHIDELKAAYDSMSLAKYGNTSQHSLYIVAAALLMKLKGGVFSLKLFRLINVAGGLFGLIFSYLTVIEMTGKKKNAFVEAMLYATLPVFFISQRAGLGEYLFLEIIPAAYWLLLVAFRTKKKFCYALSTLIFAVITLFSGVLDQSFGFANIPANIRNILALVWDDGHPFNISQTFGTIYIFSLIPLAAGVIVTLIRLVTAVKTRSYDSSIILWIYTVSCVIFGLLCANADTRACNGLFFAVSLLICEGLIYISDNLKGALIIEIAVYLICFKFFTYYYYENFNSEVNNSADHEAGIVVDKSVGEAVKVSLKELPGKDISIITDNFEGRNMMIALFGGASPDEYSTFSDSDSFSFGNIRVNTGSEYDTGGNTVYIINQAEHQDIIDSLTNQGFGNLYLKEYTICYP